MVNNITFIDALELWLNSVGSENTKIKYRKHASDFFEICTGKSVDNIVENDILEISPARVQQNYYASLKSRGLTDNSIKSIYRAISSLFTYLEANMFFQNVNYTFIKKTVLSTKNLKDDATSIKAMTYKDYDEMRSWLLKRFDGAYADKGVKYGLLLEFMWNTAARINAVMNIKWEDFVFEKDSNDVEGWAVYVLDKGGKLNYKPIQDETLYNRLVESFGNEDKGKKVFDELSQQGFAKLLKEFSEPYGGLLTPHSIKKGAVTHLYKLTKDLNLCRKFADHEDVSTTLNYIETERGRNAHGSYYLNLDMDNCKNIKDYSGEEIFEILLRNKDIDLISLLSDKLKNVK